jgi:hypothetical protein
MCYTPLIMHICCGAPWDPGNRELPVIETCKNARFDFAKEGPEWTGCPVREPKFVSEMKYPLFCQTCSEASGLSDHTFEQVEAYSGLLFAQAQPAARIFNDPEPWVVGPVGRPTATNPR